MFTKEDEGFQELFDRLLAYSSTKQSVQMSKSKRQTRRDDPMDVDALSKGKSKGQSQKGKVGSGKGNKGQNQMSRTVHFASDCRESRSGDKGSGKSEGKGKSKRKGKGKGKLNSVEDSNWQEGWLESGTSNLRTE